MNQISNWLLVLVIIAAVFAWRYIPTQRRPRETTYHIKVKFAHGIKEKLVLNERQYEQFKAWLNQPEGIFDIGDEQQFAWIDRQFVVSVTVRRK